MKIGKWLGVGLAVVMVLGSVGGMMSKLAVKARRDATVYFSCVEPFQENSAWVAVFKPAQKTGTLRLVWGEVKMSLDEFGPDVVEGSWTASNGKSYRFWLNRLQGNFQIRTGETETASGTCTQQQPQ